MRRVGGAGVLVVLALASPAAAQVTVNPGALDLLPSQPGQPGSPSRPAPSRPAPALRPPAGPPAATPAAPAPVPAPQAAVPAPRPALPTVPPAIAALPPPAPVPPPRVQPAPVPPVAANAPGLAAPLPNGVRIVFGAGNESLNPETNAALREVARGLRANTASVNVQSYASGAADDPSAARRMSLARGLTVRAVLINEGITSSRIYPRALGMVAGDADPDRVDVTMGPPGPPSPSPAAVPPAPK